MGLLQKNLGLILAFVIFYAIENVKQESVCEPSQCPVKDGTGHGVECKLSRFNNSSNPMCVNEWSSYKDCNCTYSNYRITASGKTYWCKKGSWDESLEDLRCLAPCYTDADDEAIATNPDDEETNLILDSEMVTYTCPSGYHPTGTPTVSCHNGTWSQHEIFLCHGNCSIPENYVTVNPPNKEVFPYSQAVTMKCRDGYIPSEEIIAICENESFGDIPACQSEFPCSHPNPDSELVIVTPNQTSYNNGSEITYSCPEGYDLKGDNDSVCVDGNWTSFEEPSCTALPCEDPGIEDSRVEITPDNTEYQHNERVNFSCPIGYDLIGNSSGVCQFGYWEIDDDPTCEPSSCDNPNPDDTRVVISPNKTVYQHNEEVNFSCPIEYDLKGNSSAVCQFGDWGTNDNPTCEPLPCEDPGIEDSRVEITPDNTEYQHNERVNFSCPIGYDLIGNSSGVCQFGYWEIDDDPTCEPSSCDNPNPDDTRVVISPNKTVYQHNEEVNFSCPIEYDLKGNSSAVCQFGDWGTNDNPTCEPWPCENPDIEDSRVEITPDNTEYQHNERVNFSCPIGYDLIGNSSGVCQFGYWEIDDDPTCEPSSCDNPNPDDTRVVISPNKTEYQHNEGVNFSCPIEYDLKGNSSAVCQFGDWGTNDNPTCEPSPCTNPNLADDMVEVSPNTLEYQHNDIVNFSCPNGYDLHGDSTGLCQFGHWEISLEPSCHLENMTCERPIVEDSLVTLDPDYLQYPNGTTVQFECPEGYGLLGNSNATCLSADWNPYTEPECYASPCDNPSPDDTRVIITPDSAEYQHNDTVAFSCPSGYDLMGDSDATCQLGVWEIDVSPTCEPLPCGKPSPEDDSVEVRPDKTEYQHNETVEFSCLDGYDLTGASKAICQFGVWETDGPPTCEPKKCLNQYPKDRNVIIEPYKYEYESGSTVHYSCPDGYTLSGDSSATCMFGEWEQPHDSPTCEAKGCERPTVEVNFEPNKDAYDDGETITFNCPENETLVGSDSSICTLGAFTPSSFPSCVETISETCDSSSLEGKDDIFYTPDYDTYAKDEQIYLRCKNSSLALNPFIQEMHCLGNDKWSRQFPNCEECQNSKMCQTNAKRVCDKQTRLCVCPPGYEPFEGDCIETIAVETLVSLDDDFNDTLANNSSKEFAKLEKEVCDAFKIALTIRSSNVKDGYVSCYVESFSNGSIIADVVTKYKEEKNVTPQQVTDIIVTEAEQNNNNIPGSDIYFTDTSKIVSREKAIIFDACQEKTDVCDPDWAECQYNGGSSYSCTCKAGFIDTINVTGVSCVAEVRDPPIALTVGLGAGVALCFVILLVTSVAIFARCANHDDKKMPLHDSDENDNIKDPLAPKNVEPRHNSVDTPFVNPGYNSDEYTPSALLDPVAETARMSAIADTIQNMGNMKPMPRIKPPPENNHYQINTSL